MKRLASLAAGALLLAPASPVDAQPTAEQARRADSLFAEFTVAGSPGLSVAVVRDGKTVFARGYGLANLEHQVPNTASTVFDVASVSKQFAGLAVAMLVQQGKVSLTDDIRTYIPELQVMQPPITINHLVHHTSGMRDWPGMLNLAGWRYDDVISFGQIMTFANNQRTLNFVPGAEYTYSNTGYNLLAEMVQRVTGMSFRAWTDEHLFKPLGMTSTVFRDDHTLVVPRRALGYSRAPNGSWRAVTNNLTALGSSSLMSSVDDMAKWLMNFDDARVGGEAANALARTRGVLNNGSEIPYAFGISHGTYRGAPTLSHSGSWAAFVSFLVQFPQQKAGVVVLANTPSVNTSRAAYALADIFVGDALGAMPAPPTAAVAPAAAVAGDRAPLARPANLTVYAGTYESDELGIAYPVAVRDTSLVLRSRQLGDIVLSYRGRDDFAGTSPFRSVVFERDGAGRVVSMLVNIDERSRNIRFVRR